MGTPFKTVYSAFLARIEQDTWIFGCDLDFLERDWLELMKMAIARMMFPRVDMTIDVETEHFVEELGNEEIQFLAVFMKNEWLKRNLATWKLIQQQYHTADFEFTSQANHMAKILQNSKFENFYLGF